MLPNLSNIRENVPIRGKVFGCKIERNLFYRHAKMLDVDLDQWDTCVACPDYASCYALSMAEFALGAKIPEM